MRLSLRARFALMAGLLVLAVASLAGLVAYLAMRNSLLERNARAAAGQARELATLVDVSSTSGAAEPASGHASPSGQGGNRVDISDPTLTHELALPGTVVEVLRPDGKLVQASVHPHAGLLRPPASYLARCRSIGTAQTRIGTPPLSLACALVGSPASPIATITVGAPLGDALASLRTLRTALLIGVLGGSLLSGLLALLLARRALRPIRRIAETAETIRSGDLGRRIGNQGSDELGRLAAVLDACFAELEQALERQRRFGADASHELRTPLAAIRANVELLRDWASADPAARVAAVTALDQASRRAAYLAEDLLYLARVEQEPTAAPTQVALDGVVLGVVREAQQLRPEVPIEVAHLDEASVEGDPLRLQQLLINVLDNSLRVSSAGSTVTVRLTASKGQAEITVCDQGPGIEPDQIARIFDRLYSSRRREGEQPGSGLGLTIARAIARHHGGDLTAQNNPGGGATFVFTLPLRTESRPQGALHGAEPQAS